MNNDMTKRIHDLAWDALQDGHYALANRLDEVAAAHIEQQPWYPVANAIYRAWHEDDQAQLRNRTNPNTIARYGRMSRAAIQAMSDTETERSDSDRCGEMLTTGQPCIRKSGHHGGHSYTFVADTAATVMDQCMAQAGGHQAGFTCTRIEGHDGNHQAGSSDDAVLAEWSNTGANK